MYIELSNIKDYSKEEDRIESYFEQSMGNISIKEKEEFSSYQYSYEYFISLVMYLNSFFCYTYLNIIHLFYSFFLISSNPVINYNCFAKCKKCFLVLLLLIDLLYLVAKTTFHIIYTIKEDSIEVLNDIYKYFIFENKWQNIYDYTIISIICFLNIIYLSIRNFSMRYWEEIDLEHTNEIFSKKTKNSKYVLNFGILISSLGAAVYPSGVNCIFLLFGSMFFYSLILNKTLRNKLKSVTYIFMTLIPIYTFVNYIANSPLFIDKLTDNFAKYVLIDIFNDEGNHNISIKSLLDSWNIAGCVPFICFYFGYYYMSLYLKCLAFDKKNQNIILENIPENDFRNLSNENVKGLNELNIDSKSLQIIFNENLDYAFIIFIEEKIGTGVSGRIKKFLLQYCYTPAFALHLARISVIIWINSYVTYASIILIIWLFFSIKIGRAHV